MSIEIKTRKRDDEIPTAFTPAVGGLTKLELVSALILPGMLYRRRNLGDKKLAKLAVDLAMTLLGATDREYKREVLGEMPEDEGYDE